MKKYLSTFGPLLIVFIFSLVPLSWFSDGLPILGGDVNWPLIPHKQLYQALFVWDDKVGAGFINPLVIASLFPYYLLLWFLEIAGAHLVFIQKTIYFLIFFGTGYSMYLLVRKVTNNFLSAILAALYYMFNPYNLIWWSAPDPPPLIAYAFFPLLILIFIKGLESKKPIVWAIIFGLTTLIFAPGAANLTYTVLLFFSLGLLFLFDFSHSLLITKEERQVLVRKVKFTIIAALSFFLFNAWWILPAPSFYSEGRAHWIQQNPLGNLSSQVKRAQLVNLLRLFGYPGWEDVFKVEEGRATPVSNFYGLEDKSNIKGGFPTSLDFTTNPLLMIVSFVFPLIIILGLMIRRKPKLAYFFLILWLVSLFFTKGNNPPFGNVYEFLYLHLPIFSIFRDPYHKFGVLLTLSFSFLFGYSAYSLFLYFSQRKKILGKVFLGVVISVFFASNWPFWTNNVVHNERGATLPFHVKIPNDYFQAASWLDSQKESFRVVSLPPHGIWTVYDWPYLGVDPLRQLSDKAQITQGGGSIVAQNFWESIFLTIDESKSEFISKLAALGNIRYFLLHNDSNWRWYNREKPELIATKIEKQGGLGKIQTFGKLDFYQVGEDFIPLIYTPSKLVYSTNDLSTLKDFVSLDDFPSQPAVFFAQKPNYQINDQEKNLFLNQADKILIRAEPIKHRQEIFTYPPFMRIPPNNILYRYIRFKERRSLKSATDPLSKIKIELTFSDKRLLEIKYLTDKKDFYSLSAIVGDYLALNSDIVSQAKKIFSENSPETLDYLTLIVGAFSQQQDVLKELLSADGEAKIKETLVILEKNITAIKDLEEQFSGKETTNYLLEIPESGNYQVLIKNENFDPDPVNGKKWSITFKGTQEQEFRGILRKDKWFFLGNISLSSGRLRLDIKEATANNLLKLPVDDKTEIILDSKTNNSYDKIIKTLNPKFSYKISFDYKTVKGQGPVLNVSENGNPKIESVKLEESPSWRHKEINFSLDDGARDTKISFNLDPLKIYSVVRVKNFQIERVFEPEIVLLKEREPEGLSSPSVSFTKINPTRYELEIKDADKPFFLIFSQSFHPDWKLYLEEDNEVTNGEKVIAEYFNGRIKEKEAQNSFWPKEEAKIWFKKPFGKNLLINDYANSWYITPGDTNGKTNYKLIIDFWPQRFFYWGLVISLASVLIALIYLAKIKLWPKD